MARFLLAGLILLAAAPTAHASGRFVHAFDADSEIASTGNGFAWATADGRVRVSDARGHVLHDVQPGSRCRTPAATPGVALIVCGASGVSDTWLLDTRTGALAPRPVPGEAGRIGRWWIESVDNPTGPPQGDSVIFTNWHTGEQRPLGNPSDLRRRDLDDPGLGIAQRQYRTRGGRRTILVRRGDAWRKVARCEAACGDILVWLRRVAYVDPARGLLIERRPRHRRRWHIPRALRGATLHRAGNALVLQRGAQVWRAGRQRAVPLIDVCPRPTFQLKPVAGMVPKFFFLTVQSRLSVT